MKKPNFIENEKNNFKYEMVQEILMFDNVEIKYKFHHNKIPIYLEDVYIKNVLASKKISSGQKNYK